MVFAKKFDHGIQQRNSHCTKIQGKDNESLVYRTCVTLTGVTGKVHFRKNYSWVQFFLITLPEKLHLSIIVPWKTIVVGNLRNYRNKNKQQQWGKKLQTIKVKDIENLYSNTFLLKNYPL